MFLTEVKNAQIKKTFWWKYGCHKKLVKPEQLNNFVRCYLTGTAAEVTHVSCIAENKFKVCEIIIDLNKSYQALVRKKKAVKKKKKAKN